MHTWLHFFAPDRVLGVFVAAKPLGLAPATSSKTRVGKTAAFWGPQVTPVVLEVTLREGPALGRRHVERGVQGAGVVDGVRVACRRAGPWRPIPSSAITDNRAEFLALAFGGTMEELTDRLRLTLTPVPPTVIPVTRVWVVRPWEMRASDASSAGLAVRGHLVVGPFRSRVRLPSRMVGGGWRSRPSASHRHGYHRLDAIQERLAPMVGIPVNA